MLKLLNLAKRQGGNQSKFVLAATGVLPTVLHERMPLVGHNLSVIATIAQPVTSNNDKRFALSVQTSLRVKVTKTAHLYRLRSSLVISTETRGCGKEAS